MPDRKNALGRIVDDWYPKSRMILFFKNVYPM